MRTRAWWLGALAAVALAHAARAEDEGDVDVADGRPESGGAPDSAEQERLDALVQQLSPECRAEVQGAYADGSSLSDSCKAEIQTVLQQLGGKADDGTPKSDPRPAILAFVTLLFAGLGGFWFYASTNLVPKDIAPKKKLAAKALRHKMKEQRERHVSEGGELVKEANWRR
jgi:hypothetical protein